MSKSCVILAPGPSLSVEIAQSVSGDIVGCVGNAFELRPNADFLASTDWYWWIKHPAAMEFKGRKFSASENVPSVEQVRGVSKSTNSGVLALQCAVNLGATRIELYGFDMHGTHFFGPYRNGLVNTPPERRAVHQQQYEDWKAANPHVSVLNRTKGSALRAYPYVER